jgi:threonine/homoserine/homoserine lactone efflux protein
MTATDLITFNLILAAALLSPGPALLFALRTAIAKGRRAGLMAGMGLGLMAGLWTLAALLGLGSLFALFPWIYLSLKFVGAAYLIYIAIKTWRAASEPIVDGTRTGERTFQNGILINLSNPKSVLFAAAVLVVVFPKGLDAMQSLIIVGNHIMVEVAFYGFFASLFGSGVARRSYLNARPVIDRAAAALMGTLGLKLILDR